MFKLNSLVLCGWLCSSPSSLLNGNKRNLVVQGLNGLTPIQLFLSKAAYDVAALLRNKFNRIGAEKHLIPVQQGHLCNKNTLLSDSTLAVYS